MLRMETEGTLCPGLGVIPETRVYGGLECDGMGVGKTFQALGVMNENPKPATLILCPKALIAQWIQYIQQIGFPCFVLEKRGPTKYPAWTSTYSDIKNLSAVYITNYEKILAKTRLITDRVWDRIVLDESHRIRSFDSRVGARVIKLRGSLRWAMTGTPIVNREKDVVAQLAFVGVPHTPEYHWRPSYYEPLIQSLVIHRSLEDIRETVKTAPPHPVIEDHVLEFATHAEEDFYRGLQGLRDSIRFAREWTPSILVKLLRLRQSSVSPKIYMDALRRDDPAYDKEWTIPSTKMKALAELVEESPERKFLVFCSFHDEMDMLQQYLKKRCGVDSEMYHGGLSGAEREEALVRARDPSCRIMLIQIHSGGVGLNLQQFNCCVFMCPWWTSALMEQAIARTVRIGQVKVVRVIHLILAEEYEASINIDRFMTEKAEHKRSILEKFFDHVEHI